MENVGTIHGVPQICTTLYQRCLGYIGHMGEYLGKQTAFRLLGTLILRYPQFPFDYWCEKI